MRLEPTTRCQTTHMAIGSEPEYGATFSLWYEMSPKDKLEWWEHMRTNWQPNLMNGYAKLAYPDPILREKYFDDITQSVQ